jgi:hypothetical protein
MEEEEVLGALEGLGASALAGLFAGGELSARKLVAIIDEILDCYACGGVYSPRRRQIEKIAGLLAALHRNHANGNGHPG